MPAIFNDKNIMTTIADINSDDSTTLLLKKSNNIYWKGTAELFATPARPRFGADILNNTRPTPTNNTERTHKYGTIARLIGRSSINN